jgi:WD40 repeat protein
MKFLQYITCLLITFCSIQWAQAQAHRLTPPTNCKFAKEQSTGNYPCPACSEKDNDEKAFKQDLADKREYERLKIGALAIDRSNGFYYGFAYDFSTREEAEAKAVRECEKKGGNCSVVLVFSGEACAAYRTVDGNVGTAYGWGVASTREEADQIAYRECARRSNGAAPGNYVWACNSKSPQAARTIYEAGDALPVVSKKNKTTSIKSATLTADGMYYTIVANNRVVQIYEIPSLNLVFDEDIHTLDQSNAQYKYVYAATLSPDYKYLYTIEGGKIVKRNFKTKQIVGSLNLQFSEPKIDISSNGKLIAVSNGSERTPNYIIDADRMELHKSINNTSYNGMGNVTISPNNQYVAFGARMGYLQINSLQTGALIQKVKIGGNVQGGKFSSDGSKITLSIFDEDDRDNYIADHTRVIDVKTGSVLKKYGKLASFGYNSAFIENDTKVLEVDYSDAFKVLDYQTGNILQTLKVGNFWFLHVPKSGKSFVSAGAGGIEVYVKDASGRYVQKRYVKTD